MFCKTLFAFVAPSEVNTARRDRCGSPDHVELEREPSRHRAAARPFVNLSLLVALLAAAVLVPSAALACGITINLRAIDSALAKAELPPEELARARELRAGAEALIMSGKRAEGRRTYYELMKMLGIRTSSGKFRC